MDPLHLRRVCFRCVCCTLFAHVCSLFVFSAQLCRLACFTRRCPGSQRICRHPFSRRRLLSLPETTVNSNAVSRRSTRLVVQLPSTVPVARPMRACLLFPECSSSSTLSWEMLPFGQQSRLATALTVDILQKSVFWFTEYLRLPCQSIQCAPRLQGCSESNYRAKGEVGNDSIYQDLEHWRYQRCSGRELRTTNFGFSATMVSTNVLNNTILCLPAAALCQIQYSQTVRMVFPQGSCKMRTCSAVCQSRCWKKRHFHLVRRRITIFPNSFPVHSHSCVHDY